MSAASIASNSLYALHLELQAENDAVVPASIGRYVHALFLNLIKQFDVHLSARLHDNQESRPFTISLLHGARYHDGQAILKKHHYYHLRVTLLDGEQLWQKLSTHFLEASPIFVTLGKAPLRVIRILSHPDGNKAWHIGPSSWERLLASPVSPFITIHFMSPTAFSMGERRFALFPQPELVWGSLMRSWNAHAPSSIHMDKASLLPRVQKHIHLLEGALTTTTLPFAHYVQKGFQGYCQFFLSQEEPSLYALAAFAPYAGVGYKTTMGMGQIRVTMEKERTISPSKVLFSEGIAQE